MMGSQRPCRTHGDFEGFVLRSCSDEQVFRSRERGIAEVVLRACRDRMVVSVWEIDGKIKKIAVLCR